MSLRQALDTYARDVSRLRSANTTTEPTYYPSIKSLIEAVLRELHLPLDVRASTSEARRGGGRDAPDFAIYDGSGGFVMLYVEAKAPGADVCELAMSTENNDQIGRYLASTGAVLLCTVRQFAIVTVASGRAVTGAVGPTARRLSDVVDLWPNGRAMDRGARIADDAGESLAEILEVALTSHTPIASPETLARVLARQARKAAAALPDHFTTAVESLREDFASALGIAFEGEEGEHFFRSSLIQTVFYGIFAGWLLHSSEWRQTPFDDFDWRRTGDYLRIPFLAGLFHEFQNPLRLRELGLRDYLGTAAATLGRVDKREFFTRLKPGGLEDDAFTSAIVYFYEPFLAAFDPELREELGVWYTPPDIVRYQVRRIDRLLREELGCSRGLADDSVVVLDPACGTGAYLIETLRCIAETLRSEGVGAELAATLRAALECRIHGFEILTAPFVVAHLQVYLLLSELGAAPDENHRAGIFLTNALTGWHETPQVALHFPELQVERDAAQRVKRDAKVLVVVGNPPYNRFAGAAVREEESLVDRYKGIRRDDRGRPIGQSDLWTRWGVRKQLLDDLYVRFFRLAEECIGIRAEFGIVSYISNSSFLSGRSHPIMRESLLGSFDSVWIDNLNGDKYRTGKIIPDGAPGAGSVDASVFVVNHQGGIQVGTCISTWVKRRQHAAAAESTSVYYRDFWGDAERKRQALIESLDSRSWSANDWSLASERPEGPRPYALVQTSAARKWKLVPYETTSSYEEWPGIDQLFVLSAAGINVNRGLDNTVIDTERSRLVERMRRYFGDLSDEDFFADAPELGRTYAGYEPRRVRDAVRTEGDFRVERIVPYVLFPLDARWLYYEPNNRLLNRPRPEIAAHLANNEFLIVVNESRRASETKPLLARTAFDLHVFDVGAQAFFAERSERVEQALDIGESTFRRVANIAPVAWERLSMLWALHGDLAGEDARKLTRKLFHLALAVGHAPAFQRDFAGSLAHDWLHLPIPRSLESLDRATGLGEKVALLLDPFAPQPALRDLLRQTLGADLSTLAVLCTSDGGSADEDDLRVEIAHFGASPGGWRARETEPAQSWRPGWGLSTGDLWLNSRVYFRNVPERVWHFELGGYQVIKKWLGYREARRRNGAPLSFEEKDHLRTMIHRLAVLASLDAELDAAYALAAAEVFSAEELGLG